MQHSSYALGLTLLLCSCASAKEVAMVAPASSLSIIGDAQEERAAPGTVIQRSVTIRNASPTLTEHDLEVRVAITPGSTPQLSLSGDQPSNCALENDTVACSVPSLSPDQTANVAFSISVSTGADCRERYPFHAQLCRRGSPKFDCLASDEGQLIVACAISSSSDHSSAPTEQPRSEASNDSAAGGDNK